MGIGFDTQIYENVYWSREMAEVFSSERQVESWLQFESALANAEASLNIIPSEAAEEIARHARVKEIDLAEYARQVEHTVHPIVPLVNLLTKACSGNHGQYVHWGATTQDVMDTGMVLQMRAAHQLMLGAVDALIRALVKQTREHIGTLMPGRTHAQHAVPITFGYKLAVYLDELRRQRGLLCESAQELEVVQFGGAAGTLASLGEIGIAVRDRIAAELGLGVPDITWHVSRDRLARYAFHVVGVAAVTQKIAREVITLQRPELDELAEPFHMGKVGSSTMPHKRNPSISEVVWTLGGSVVSAFQTMLGCLLQEHEREMAVWQMEWDALPRLMVLAHKATATCAFVVDGLEVHVERMRSNVDLSRGMISSEAVMMGLAERVGRQHAHHLVYDVAMASAQQQRPFDDMLRADPRLGEHLAVVDQALDPEKSVGAAKRMTQNVVDRLES